MHDSTAPELILGADGRFRWVAADRVLPFVCGADGETPAEVTIPPDLTVVEPDELTAMRDAAQASLDELGDRARSEPDTITSDDANRAAELNGAVQALNAEIERRAGEQRANVDAVLANMADPEPEPAPEPVEGDEPPAEPVEEPAVEVVDAADLPEPVAASARRPITVPAVPRRPTLNQPLSLAEIAANAPAPTAPARRPAQELVITAANNLNGFDNGQRLDSLEALADAFAARASAMPITRGVGVPQQVASIRRQYEHAMDELTTLEEADRIFREAIGPDFQSFQQVAALVAAGGWCAPSEIDYSFFNVAAPGGLVDLPTIGIRRGGIRWPISLTLADFFGLSGAPASGIPSNATMPWEWTETDDILAATGSPTKSCLRPPCPTFDEARLRVWGLCVLAGNLTEAAYPELIRHFLMLSQIAHDRVMNRRHIAQMVAHSTVTAVSPVVGASTSVFTHWLGSTELLATHLRYKYGAPLNSVIEVDFPAWARGLFRNDLARRNGWDDLAATDAYIAEQFDRRNIRTQWLEDWQSLPGSAGPANTIGASTAPTAWPTSFQALMNFPGHFFKGAGFNLNLGVVRDSVLNKANDHTAAWSEEGTLIGARFKEALLITNASAVYPEGTTGAQVDQSSASA